jgi:hypothetical protein
MAFSSNLNVINNFNLHRSFPRRNGYKGFKFNPRTFLNTGFFYYYFSFKLTRKLSCFKFMDSSLRQHDNQQEVLPMPIIHLFYRNYFLLIESRAIDR